MREAAEKAAAGPKPFPSSFDNLGKRKRVPGFDDELPKHRRGLAWSSSSSSTFSPSASYTEIAPPLPRPPSHLLQNHELANSLARCSDHVKVETPFNVDRLSDMLVDHPNQPFVQSVLTGLREGFWPLEDGEWKLELEEVVGNYSTEEPDLDAIRAFRDKEQAAGRWSGELSELLPGMKISPMFVVWRDDKARVVTDHTASGLNDGIPRAEAKVRYDNMTDFGQEL
ncbi:uncharacterized protein B0H18DRAFT_881736, partial [Fomitopsis serialis]|uniref:uncharacterized protein n=1 Tax=Fomitopsis serialis TaxID=139415 RepID=UPI002008925C